MTDTFPSKLLLFGEYLALIDGPVLAVPFGRYSCEWQQGDGEQYDLPELADYITHQLPALDGVGMTYDLNEGWYLRSDIPRGYGLGSSGAVCAAVYERYAYPDAPRTGPALKRVLQQLEGYYHGQSSGVDPLISYARKAYHARGGDSRLLEWLAPDLPDGHALFLWNTGQGRHAQPLIKAFVARYREEQGYAEQLRERLLPVTEQLLDAFLSGEYEQFSHLFGQLSALQLELLRPMIPDVQFPMWQAGLVPHSTYHLKLCGAGGGGFVMGYTTDWVACPLRSHSVRVY